ncbi:MULTISPECIES: DUF423 domain-containing protein [Paenibacillus]|uniref:DUF423 domain-containing protein n=1 Tax=Paenibacillus campinasensis TaxID=66347 RepID=A0ABW9SZ98_9BACL|nr:MULTISPECIES: DUF423 domain-containing protein [Paenibacillus]MUG66179.1 DUF423 domain-containing protein [Paenibacillus campinasensis]PAK49422.1 hypothetical protein CHH75_20890 [Paenibacillus sp. 7541]
MQRMFIAWGAVLMALSVAIGAFGAHMLEDRIGADALAVYETGVHYHMIHGIAILITGLLAGVSGNSRGLFWVGTLFIVGTIIFSGSLYVLSISGIKWLGAITPIGGTAFIAGWIALMVSALSGRRQSR